MAGRRYPTAELYEERQRDVYRNGRGSTRQYEELDVDIRQGRELDFLDDGYGRPTAGALVRRDRDREIEVEDSISVRGRDRSLPARRARSVSREEIIVRRGERDRFRRQAEREELDVTIRTEKEEQPARPRRRPRNIERDEVHVRRSDPDLARRDVHRDEVIIRHEDRAGRPGRTVDHEDDITIRHNNREIRGRDFSNDRESIHVRHRSSSRGAPPRGNLVRRDEDDIVIRRRRSHSSSPAPPRRDIEREEIIIRRERERSPTPPPPPEPEPPIILPIVRPPIHQQIHQEIITHHRHIDHGVERAYSPSPSPSPVRELTPPPPPPRKVEETIEVDIRRRGRRGSEEEIVVDHRERSRVREHDTTMVRHRSLSAPRRHHYDDELEEEAEYYNRKALERARIGEAHNGATKDWEIVDVPPGTERVRMDGAGGSSQEITWQRYNGVRRSKFIAGDREFDTGFGMPDQQRAPSPTRLPPSRPRPTDMWTEVTKDLVVRDAIDAFGYQYEETEFFFYIMEYMRYEDVLQLVELSDDIRRDRRRRIREIEWERESLRHSRPSRGRRYYDHEVVVDTRRRH